MERRGGAMSDTGNEFERLMERVRTGDAEAARILFDRYGPAIRMVVRRRLNRHMRTEFDSLDFVQDAWASFFRLTAERCTFQTPEELVAFLLRMTRNKLSDAYRQRYQTEAHNLRKLRHLRSDLDEQDGRHPTPSQFAIAEEEWDRMLLHTPPKLRHALELLRAGHSKQEIAEGLGLHPKTIQRLLQKLNERQQRSP